jgi:hypothetical protein
MKRKARALTRTHAGFGALWHGLKSILGEVVPAISIPKYLILMNQPRPFTPTHIPTHLPFASLIALSSNLDFLQSAVEQGTQQSPLIPIP